MLISGCSAESECWELYYDEDGVKNWRYYEDIGCVGGIVFDDESYAEHIWEWSTKEG